MPEHLGDERVAAILQQKRPWIRSKVAQLQQLHPHRPKEPVSGESFPYLGRHYRLKVQAKQFWDFISGLQEVRRGVRKARHKSSP